MALQDQVIWSQLIPPRQRRGVLCRSRLDLRLQEALDHPLTIVQAGTGYGKSTSLAALGSIVDRLCWYTITEPDRDPPLFLAHLICAFGGLDPAWCDPALQALEESGGRVTPRLLTPLLNVLTHELDDETVLVLDDYHLVADVQEIAALVERLVDYVPPRLHIVLSSRHMPPLASLTRWQVKGQVLLITRDDLAFTSSEIETLFEKEYGYSLSTQQAQVLATETEGWAIALQMIWQSLQSGAVDSLDAVLSHFPATLEALFDYLALDVLGRQAPDVQRFLLTTSVLRQMDGPACDHLLQVQDSDTMLRWIHDAGLFVVSVGNGEYRYHRLFHDFLRTQLERAPSPHQAQDLHRRAAVFFRQAGKLEETVYHLLEAQDNLQAAMLIQEIGPQLVEMGRLDRLGTWIACVPEEVRAAQPGLDLLLGDVVRLRARFDQALEHYVVAEQSFAAHGDRLGRSRALRGQAQVYLDTVRPLKADSLLEEALRLLEPEEQREETAEVLDQLAENKLNLGYPDEAQALYREAHLLRAESDGADQYLAARALVRTGQLAESRRLLEGRAEEERRVARTRPQRFHRETLLLLSLVNVLQGDAKAAERYAREGIAIGQKLRSAFVEAVGYMRLGHALQLRGTSPWASGPWDGLQQAIRWYERAIELVRGFKVMRTQVEPLWGLCRAHGSRGDLAAAERYAQQAVEILERAGDEWMHNLLLLIMGANYVQAGAEARSREWLIKAADGFDRVGDAFARSAVWLWLALAAWRQRDGGQMAVWLSNLLPQARERDYGVLLTSRTFVGLRDEQSAIPLLLEARRQGIEVEYVGELLEILGASDIEYHPGYSLAVRTLGPFSVWRGATPIADRDWRREKARQVFQLLLTYRGQWFYREQIVDHLWPHLPPEPAERDFKVALNALRKALEPDRPPGAKPFFIVRHGNVYGMNPVAHIRVDVDDFERLASSDDMDCLRHALSLYQGNYLPDSLYEDWPAAERQRLRHLFLVTAERLARHLLRAKEWDECVEVCQSILTRDNCWEAAYRLLMEVYAAQDNRPQVHAIYQRCTDMLRQELGVEPSPTTRALFEKLT